MSSHRTVDLALMAVAFAWGSSYLATKGVVTQDDVFAFLVLRFAIAAVGLAIILAPRLRRATRSELRLGMLFGAVLSVVLVLETFGVTMTSASNAGLIISLTIVMTPVLDRWIRRTALPPAFYGGAAIAVVGVGLLTQGNGLTTPGLGDGLILLAAAARAVHVTVMARLSAGRVLDSARVTLIQLCTALVTFVVLTPFTGRGVADVAAHLDARSWLLVLHLALVCTVFAFLVQLWAVRRTSPSRVSLLLGTEPVWAAIIGVVVAADPVTLIGACGAACVLGGTNWGRVALRTGSRSTRRSTSASASASASASSIA
ncbi:DMT family transporter [Mycolicibacterium sp. 050158]|uniref:DMT family transporter n=1 Tax=Mycolicibacterium sp. 050158 TaxID=3090602 RepID=UPI00299E18B3|nr:DMT family transporter [Mycolicibacterium sp. 050158]MDX1890437.1 DMT family transporter [Mycolicibacterium sp. 050158]